MSAELEDAPVLYPTECPHCGEPHEIEGESFEGYAETCIACRALLQLAFSGDGTIAWWFVEKPPPLRPMTGRQRTRRRWRRQGRR